MNKLSTAERTRIVACMVEGNSMRATCRMTGAAKKTVAKLLVDMGTACSAFQDRTLRNLPCKRIQCDEIWAFVGAKEKNASDEQKENGWGDCWTWTAIDPQTKLVPCWFVGTRDAGAAYHFIHDLADRLANRVQLTTDGHKAYLSAVEDAFGADVDYAMLVKIYGNAPEGGEVRYSPAQCMGARKAVQRETHLHVDCGAPEPQHANGDAPLYPPHKRLFKEDRKPRARAGDLLHALQLLPHSRFASSHSRNGGWRCGSLVEFGRNGWLARL